jgi:MFS family permease
VSFGEGINVLSGRQRAAGWVWPRRSAWFWLACGCSLLGYFCLFLLLHLNSLGWAPGQILEPFTVYWQLFYRVVFDQDRVHASRRSAAAALHPALMIGALGVIATGYITMLSALRALPEARRPRLRGLLGLALLFSLPLILLPNLLSGDIYSYISFGRIATLHAGNPFVDPPGSFRHDMYLQWVNWSAVPSVYGPTWIYLSILLTVLVESVHSSVLVYVLAYKLLALLLHLLSGALIWAILWHWKPEQRSWGTALYLLNPLALIEFGGNGHNDALMIALILLGILFHLRGQWLWTVVAFTLAVLTKWIALPLLPLYGLLLLAGARQWKRRLQYAAGCLGMFAGLTAALYLPYWQGPVTLKVLLDAPPQKRLINSLGDMVVRETQYGMYLLGYWPHPALRDFSPLLMRLDQARDTAQDEGQAWRKTQRTRLQRYNQIQAAQQLAAQAHERALAAVTRFTGLLLLLVTCIVGAFVTRNLRTMLLAGAWIFFVYTTIAAVWVWPWYATWFVALAALLDWRVTGRTAIMLSLLMLLLYPLFPALPEPALIERYRALLVFGPPLAYAGLHFLRLARSYRREWSVDEIA